VCITLQTTLVYFLGFVNVYYIINHTFCLQSRICVNVSVISLFCNSVLVLHTEAVYVDFLLLPTPLGYFLFFLAHVIMFLN